MFTFRAQATKCSRHHNWTVMDAGCECVPGVRSANPSDSWTFVVFALPISSCGLKPDDEVVRIAVGLRLGLNLCVSHVSCCDAGGLHGFVCKQDPARALQHPVQCRAIHVDHLHHARHHSYSYIVIIYIYIYCFARYEHGM